MIQPYYQDGQVTIYCGDSREILPLLAPVDSIITDPVWPNAISSLAGASDPVGLFKAATAHFPRLARRVIVQLGCDSDPRFLQAIPEEMPFFRTCFLEYVRPHYKGRLFYTNDVAYAFGTPPASKPGARVIPGKTTQTDAARIQRGTHPCPRQLQHVRWLVKWFAEGVVLDPFAGIGTTLLAARAVGWPAIGIEVEERYCEVAAKRFDQQPLPLREAV